MRKEMNTEALEQQQVPITTSEALYMAEQEGGNQQTVAKSWLARPRIPAWFHSGGSAEVAFPAG